MSDKLQLLTERLSELLKDKPVEAALLQGLIEEYKKIIKSIKKEVKENGKRDC